MSAPGALKNSSHRRLRKDAVNLGDPENEEHFPKFVARRSWILPGFLFPRNAEGTGVEQAAADTLLFFGWSRRPEAAP